MYYIISTSNKEIQRQVQSTRFLVFSFLCTINFFLSNLYIYFAGVETNGILYDTYHDACRELHLLEYDNYWDSTHIRRTSTEFLSLSYSPYCWRHVFRRKYFVLWDKHKDSMSDDILHRIRTADRNPNIDFSPEIYNKALIKIEDISILISNMPSIHFSVPSSNRPATDIINSDVPREQQLGVLLSVCWLFYG